MERSYLQALDDLYASFLRNVRISLISCISLGIIVFCYLISRHGQALLSQLFVNCSKTPTAFDLLPLLISVCVLIGVICTAIFGSIFLVRGGRLDARWVQAQFEDFL